MQTLETGHVPVKLHPLDRGKRDNRFCGPAVIGFLTGMNTADAAKAIRQISGKRQVTGTKDWHLEGALRCQGFYLKPLALNGRTITLARWLKESKAIRTPGRVFLISAGKHWQLITGRRYACGRIGEIVSVRDERVKRRARMRRVWEVLKH